MVPALTDGANPGIIKVFGLSPFEVRAPNLKIGTK
jgi:hypothetical protein